MLLVLVERQSKGNLLVVSHLVELEKRRERPSLMRGLEAVGNSGVSSRRVGGGFRGCFERTVRS